MSGVAQVPTAPGWWWLEFDGLAGRQVDAVRCERLFDEMRYCHRDCWQLVREVGDSRRIWRGPVSPPGEAERLQAELAKPVASPWATSGQESERMALCRHTAVNDGDVWSAYGASPVCRVTPIGWTVRTFAAGFLGAEKASIVASGPETGDEGRRLADAAAVAAGWRLL